MVGNKDTSTVVNWRKAAPYSLGTPTSSARSGWVSELGSMGSSTHLFVPQSFTIHFWPRKTISQWWLHQYLLDFLAWWRTCQYQLPSLRQQEVHSYLSRSLLQTVSVVGYCAVPLAVGGFLVALMNTVLPIWIRLPLILIALGWSSVSCVLVMA